MTIATGSRLGPYEVLSPLGAGGMGEVYRARDERLKREVAIKVLPVSFSTDPDRLRRFEQEARAAGILNHPNLTAVLDIGEHEGAPYVVQELLEGETLRGALADGRLAPRKAIDFAIQIAHGLAAAHEKGIVHRDLKPENVFVTKDGRDKIHDFGLAKLTQVGQSGASTNLPTVTPGTEPGVVMGTLGYMSPEQVKGRPAVGLAFGATVTADDLIWMKEPDELVSLNETRLKAMGVKPSISRAFRLNRQYNLTRQVRLVSALDALDGVPGRPEFVARAAGAQVDADAQFYTESALLTELFHRTQEPVMEIVADLPGACVLAADDRFACLFPLDYIAWTEGVAGHFDRITKRIELDFPKAKRELWLTGRVSPRTANELQARGWSVREKSLSLLSEVPPEPTPVPEKTSASQ